MSRKAEMLRERRYANIVEIPDDECLGEVASRQRRAVVSGELVMKVSSASLFHVPASNREPD
jgi:hypothetical protein